MILRYLFRVDDSIGLSLSLEESFGCMFLESSMELFFLWFYAPKKLSMLCLILGLSIYYSISLVMDCRLGLLYSLSHPLMAFFIFLFLSWKVQNGGTLDATFLPHLLWAFFVIECCYRLHAYGGGDRGFLMILYLMDLTLYSSRVSIFLLLATILGSEGWYAIRRKHRNSFLTAYTPYLFIVHLLLLLAVRIILGKGG
ncbi:MAG: hypothetical protein K6C69_08075 [Lachnospiraceae bacterium]|nr:hypothetical protein [Lachnospiraceae bacterium]